MSCYCFVPFCMFKIVILCSLKGFIFIKHLRVKAKKNEISLCSLSVRFFRLFENNLCKLVHNWIYNLPLSLNYVMFSGFAVI